MRWVTIDDDWLDMRVVSGQSSADPGLVFPSAGWLTGWLLTNTDPADALTVDLTDGQDASGVSLGLVIVSAANTDAHSRGLPGIPLTSGLYVTTGGAALAYAFTIGVPR